MPTTSTLPLPPQFARAAENLRAWSAALPVLTELNRRDIPFIVLKSLPQIEEIYGSAAGRVTGDVDLIVRGEDANEVLEIAGCLGWKFKFPMRYRVLCDRLGAQRAAASGPWPLQLEQNGHYCDIDLHTDCIPVWRYPPLDASIWTRAQLSCLDGVRFLLLSSEDRLVFLCWHALVEGLPPRKLDDIARILRDGDALDWDAVAERARVTQTVNFLYLVCDYVAAHSDAPLHPYWRDHVPLVARTRFALMWRTVERLDSGIGSRHALLLRLLGHDRPSEMLPLWRLALLPSRLEVATRIGYIPSWHRYVLELGCIYWRRLAAYS